MSAKPTCQSCRKRKVRCDGGIPTCRRCVTGRRICSYQSPSRERFSFRYSHLSSITAKDLRSASSPQSALSGDNGAVVVGGNADATQATNESPAQLITTPNNYEVGTPSDELARFHSSLFTDTNVGVSTPGPFVTSPHTQQSDRASLVIPSPWDRDPASPLSSVQAELMEFYVDEIGPWLDTTSPERHFTYLVPQLALRCNVLFYAIIACAAHLLRLIQRNRGDLNEVENVNHDDCVRLLIPMLDCPSTSQNEAVFAAIGTLRMSEQWDEFYIDRQYHLVPSCFSCFDRMQTSSTAQGGLLEATFYAYVRADIRMAILGRCPTKMEPSKWALDTSTPSTDGDWANRATWLLLQIINLTYGHDVAGVLPRGELEILVNEWKKNLPKSFMPYSRHDSDDSPFPTIKLLAPWHVVGLQFYHTCKILLAINNPIQPAFPDVLKFNQYVEAQILAHARDICALAFSNEHVGTRINGSHLVAVAAQYFTGREERRMVWKYFDELYDLYAWPSKACQDMLRQAYGGTVC